MNTIQSFKKTFYPVLKTMAKWVGVNGKIMHNERGVQPSQPIYTLTANSNDGELISMHTFRKKYLLIVNTASDCGYTAQYEELQQLQDQYKDKLKILAFPSNDFGGQEPGTNDDIADFCKSNFGVEFPVMMKSDVVGQNINPVFNWLTDPSKNGWNKKEPGWNFYKYLINPNGILVGLFESGVSPLDKEITQLIV